MALFITFEGGEGSGKTVQARSLDRRLSLLAIPALLVQEPGGTSLECPGTGQRSRNPSRTCCPAGSQPRGSGPACPEPCQPVTGRPRPG